MKKHQLYYIFLSILVFSFTDIKGNQSERIRKVDLMIELSGAKKSFEQVPALMKQQAISGSRDISQPWLREKFPKIMADNFRGEILLQEIRNAFLIDYNETKVAKILSYLQTKDARMFTKMDVTATRPSIYEEVAKFDLTKADKARIAITRQLVNDLQLVEMGNQISQAAVKGMFSAFNAILPEGKKFSKKQMAALVEKAKQNETAYREWCIKYYLISYKNASNQQIRNHSSFYRSAAGRYIIKNSRLGFKRGFEKASANVARALTRELKKWARQQ